MFYHVYIPAMPQHNSQIDALGAHMGRHVHHHPWLGTKGPWRAGVRPPPAKKQAVREAPPVCLRNIFASDDPRADDEHNVLMHSLPRSIGHSHSRFECVPSSAG